MWGPSLLIFFMDSVYVWLVVGVFLLVAASITDENSTFVVCVVGCLFLWFLMALVGVENNMFVLLIGILYIGGMMLFFSYSVILSGITMKPKKEKFLSFLCVMLILSICFFWVLSNYVLPPNFSFVKSVVSTNEVSNFFLGSLMPFMVVCLFLIFSLVFCISVSIEKHF